ncbi:MAG TPA: long-chain-fatty-acid--CoA ligase [Nocardioidaceae bacterium]|nr:long-chain-fatty-acid--CoA ligase [Nocardioidaceae bacterium]
MNVRDERPWAASYPPGVPLDVEIPEESLVELLDASVRRFGPKVALDFFGATTTYTELGRQVDQAAEVLRRLGVGPGDRVALILPNCPQHVVAFYAVLRLGAVVVEHNPLYTHEELEFQLGDHRPKVIVAWDKVASMADEIGSDLGTGAVLAVSLPAAMPLKLRLALQLPVPKARESRREITGGAPGLWKWDRLVSQTPALRHDYPRPRATDIALLQYTGGTTGRPKGAVLTHRNLRANAAQGLAWLPGIRQGEEVVYGVLPLFHAYGLTLCLTFAIAAGATLVLFPRFDVDMMLEAMGRRPATFLPAVPPIYAKLAETARERNIDLTSIRYAFSGAMALPRRTAELWETATGGVLVEGYGLTETSPVATGNPVDDNRPGTIGVPLPSTEAKVVDRDDPDKQVARGEPGELLLRGPQVFREYWNRPQETAGVVLEDGWMRTGDVVVMDDDGYLTIVDRIKDLIITGGFNVYPSEVEEALRQVPGVADAAVVGIPAEHSGEDVVAAVVMEPGAEFDEDGIREASRERLTPYKVPRRVFDLEELPRTVIGKVLHRRVRDELEKRLAAT